MTFLTKDLYAMEWISLKADQIGNESQIVSVLLVFTMQVTIKGHSFVVPVRSLRTCSHSLTIN